MSRRVHKNRTYKPRCKAVKALLYYNKKKSIYFRGLNSAYPIFSFDSLGLALHLAIPFPEEERKIAINRRIARIGDSFMGRSLSLLCCVTIAVSAPTLRSISFTEKSATFS